MTEEVENNSYVIIITIVRRVEIFAGRNFAETYFRGLHTL